MVKYCGIALCALTAVLLLRPQKSEFAGYIGIAASVILFGAAITSFLPIFGYIREITAGTVFTDHLGALAKAVGITLAVQFTADVCRDAGESALASKLELVGKTEILLLCLPLVAELISLASELMQI